MSLIVTWNPTIRLVASAEPAEIWTRHVDDSLQLANLIEASGGQAADVGSGAGFPGLVLAIALERHFYLIESDRRKAAFLMEAARITQAKVTVVPSRVETVTFRCRVVTARAFTSIARTLQAVHGMLTADAVCVLPKGRSAEEELQLALRDWRMRVERFPSLTDATATILRLSEITRA